MRDEQPKRYRVQLMRREVWRTMVEVEASSGAEARRKALEIARTTVEVDGAHETQVPWDCSAEECSPARVDWLQEIESGS
jgi:hypothetical protein